MADVAGSMTIEYIKNPDNTITLLPSEREAKMFLTKIKASPKDKGDEDGSQKAERDRLAQEQYDKIASARDAATESKRLVKLEVKYEPYTRAHKMEARRLATTGDGDGSKFDAEVFEAHLIAMSTNLDFETVIHQPESVYQILSEKVFSGQNVSVDRLDFFDSSPTT